MTFVLVAFSTSLTLSLVEMTTPQWLGRSYTETSSMYSETPMSESETPILERDSLHMAQPQPDPAVEAVRKYFEQNVVVMLAYKTRLMSCPY